MLEHKGYLGDPRFDAEHRVFAGRVLNIARDGIHFEGRTVDEVEQAFRDSIDDYLEWCGQEGREPEKPHSGKFMVRIDPALHGRAVEEAVRREKSLNAFVGEAISAQIGAAPKSRSRATCHRPGKPAASRRKRHS